MFEAETKEVGDLEVEVLLGNLRGLVQYLRKGVEEFSAVESVVPALRQAELVRNRKG